MSKIDEITRQSWIESTFRNGEPGWVEDIENEVVKPRQCGNVVAWMYRYLDEDSGRYQYHN